MTVTTWVGVSCTGSLFAGEGAAVVGAAVVGVGGAAGAGAAVTTGAGAAICTGLVGAGFEGSCVAATPDWAGIAGVTATELGAGKSTGRELVIKLPAASGSL